MDDVAIYKRVPLHYAAACLWKGPYGGALLFVALYAGDERIRWTSEAGFFFWNGTVWQRDLPEAQGGVVHNLIAAQLTELTRRVRAAQAGLPSLRLPRRLTIWTSAGAPASVIKFARPFFLDNDFFGTLNVSSKFCLPLPNGVIDLNTGVLHPHHPRFRFSFLLKVPWPAEGLELPLDVVLPHMRDMLMVDEHPDRADVVVFWQRVFG